jgi:uncharacterized protein YcnI
MNPKARLAVALASAVGVALLAASSAFAHAHVSPPVALAKASTVFTVAVPTEKEDATTTKVVLTVPEGFSVDSFTASPGWKRTVEQTGAGEDAVISKVTWTGGSVPAGEATSFSFLGRASKSGTYSFRVQQTYSDGSIVDWAGPESAEDPAPTIEAKSSFGGGGGSTLGIVGIALAAVALLLAGAALVSGGGKRELI